MRLLIGNGCAVFIALSFEEKLDEYFQNRIPVCA
jgi:hypothetical protein